MGVWRNQSGIDAAMPIMNSDLPRKPKDSARYKVTMDSTERIACRLRSCAGRIDSRSPVSISVRTTLPSSMSGQATSKPTIGASQRKPESQAITTQAVPSCSRPVGWTTLRSRILAHISVSERIGRVISHSRSQSDLASSPDATPMSSDEIHNSDSRNATPTASAVLNSTVSQKVSGGSSDTCRLITACAAIAPNTNSMSGQDM